VRSLVVVDGVQPAVAAAGTAEGAGAAGPGVRRGSAACTVASPAGVLAGAAAGVLAGAAAGVLAGAAAGVVFGSSGWPKRRPQAGQVR
jgi:hypothetical protein